MPLAKVSEIVQDARKRKYGVAAYDVVNYENMKWIVEAAEEEGVPVILMLYPSMQGYISFDVFAAMAKQVAKNAKVPVGVHLDHSNSFEEVMKAIAAGFPSVMYDGSAFPVEQNTAICRQVVQAAHAMGIDVEGEIGHVGSGSRVEDFKNAELYTTTEQLEAFIEETGVDLCAVAIGNSHGVYIEKPELHIPLLSKLDAVAKVPLVLHGTSGIPEEQVTQAVLHGVTKTNIATEMFSLLGEAFAQSFGEGVNWYAGMAASKKIMTEYYIHKIRVLNPNGVRVI